MAPLLEVTALPEPGSDLVYAVVGPTGSGKTDLAVALARRFGGEIVSADSIQIYRHFELGTGKPDSAERALHHLIDAIEPFDDMDAAEYARRATEAIGSIRARGKVPIVCGGTFLWVRALLLGLAAAPPRDEAIRKAHRSLVEASGPGALHDALRAVDPASAARLHPNDVLRVSRSLEVWELTRVPQSVWHEKHAFRTVRVAHRLLTPETPESEVERNVAARVRGWLARGWIDEVRAHREAGYGAARAMQSVGFRQVNEWLDAPEHERVSLDDLGRKIVQATRIFVRRQRTWLRDETLTVVSTRP